MATMADFTLDEFIANVRQYNLARANRFEVVITPPIAMQADWGSSMRRMSISVEDTALPGKTLETARLRINGLSEQRARTIDFFGEAINFTFFIDDTWDIKAFIEDWHNLIIDPRSREVNFYDNYKGSIELRVFSVNDELRHSVQLEEAWPRSVQLIQVAQSSNQVQRLVVSFAFKRWSTLVWDYGLQQRSTPTDQIPSAAAKVLDFLIHNANTIIQARPSRIPLSILPGFDDLGPLSPFLP